MSLMNVSFCDRMSRHNLYEELPQPVFEDMLKSEESKLQRLQESGLIGCLNNTDITSENYKEKF